MKCIWLPRESPARLRWLLLEARLLLQETRRILPRMKGLKPALARLPTGFSPLFVRFGLALPAPGQPGRFAAAVKMPAQAWRKRKLAEKQVLPRLAWQGKQAALS